MKVKKHFYCIVVVLALWAAGCGGGGKNSPLAPPVIPPSQPSSPPSNPDNPPDNSPSNPSDNPLQPPSPSNPQAPSNPAPSLRVWYPSVSDPESVRVVGSGTLLTILGEVYGADQILVYDQDGSLLETFEVNPGIFRVDLSQFGLPGRKTLRVVARGSGGESSVEVEVINDEGVLSGLAEEAISKYRMRRFARSPWGTEIPIPVWIENQQYRSQVEEALQFWTRYSKLKLEIKAERPPVPAIDILDKTDRDPGIIAETSPGSSTGEMLDVGVISLYSRFADLQPEVQAAVVAHELWHALTGGAGEVTDLGFRFVGWPWLNGGIEVQIVPPLIQKAFYLLYR